MENFLAFVELGFRHILPLGLDHILFVIALFLTARGWRPLLLQVSVFTLAHSLTLGLAAAGFVDVPAAIVEPLIALSIAIVGLEALVFRKAHPWRLVVVLVFGLCHGLGFAAMMKGFLEGSDFLTALAGFNVGVELGQIAVLAACGLVAFGVRALLRAANRPGWYDWAFTRPVALLIVATGLFWTAERLGWLPTAAA